MTEPLVLRYTVTPELLNRAMVSWQPPFDWKKRTWPLRVVLPILVGGLISGILAATGVYDRLGTPLLAGLVTGVLIGFFAMLWTTRRQAAKMGQFAQDYLARQGVTKARFDAEGIRLVNNLGEAFMRWQALDQVIAMKDGTALRFGAMVHPVPHRALPGTMTGSAFEKRLNDWKNG